MSPFSTAPSSHSYIKASWPAPHVLLLSVERAPVNAYNEALWRELGAAFDAVNADDGTRVVVLTSGLEKGFTAGLDLTDTGFMEGQLQMDLDPGRRALQWQKHIHEFQAAITSIAECRVPVITAVHGICIGLGVDICSAADIRLAARNTIFSIREVAIGMAADIGTLQRAPKIVGSDSLVRELALTGRFFDAGVAEKLGFLSRVVEGSKEEVLAEALKVASEIAVLSPMGTMGTKHLMNHARDHSIDEGLRETALWNSVMLQSNDMLLAMKHFTEKRKGTVQFPGLGGKLTKAKL